MGKLVRCATCGDRVSTAASSCPHCGEVSFRQMRRVAGFTNLKDTGKVACHTCDGAGTVSNHDYQGNYSRIKCNTCNGYGIKIGYIRKNFRDGSTERLVRCIDEGPYPGDIHYIDEYSD